MRGRTAEWRAATNTLGYVLLLGLVVTSAAVLFVVGGDVIQRVETESRGETGELLVQEVDAKLGSVASAPGDAASSVEIGDKQPSQVAVADDGRLEIRVNGGACTRTFDLGGITVDSETGETVGYQAGGVWRLAPDGGSVMVAPPDVTFQNRSLNVRLVNFTGDVHDDRFRTVKNETASVATTSNARETLLTGGCARPRNVTVEITSAYHEAWAAYLREEVGTTVTESGSTVSFTLNQSDLPRAVDDSRNRVVNLSNASIVDPDPSNGRLPGSTLTIDKSAGNRYFVSGSIVPGGASVSDIETFDGGAILRRPVDVVVVMDESGSMSGSKNQNAEDAAQEFVGLIDVGRDRVAFVGYTTESRYLLVDGDRYFGPRTDALDDDTARDELNTTIDQYVASGGTAINRGLNASLDVHDVKSNASRDRHVILLSDGQNSPGTGDCQDAGFSGENAACRTQFDEWTLAGAREAADQDITVHTIAFGSSPDEQLMKDVANETGGTYSRATTGAELEAVFESIFQEITESEQIVNYPVSTEMTIDGTTFYPTAPGNTSGVASVGDYTNLNDPSFTGAFTYATETGDGALMAVSAVRLECEDWELTPIEQYDNATDETYNEVRCTNATAVNATLPPSNVTVMIDGADVSGYRSSPDTWWQPDFYNDTLAPYRDGDELDLESNQALVVYEYADPRAATGTNRLVMLYEFGLPESAQAASVLDVTVTEVRIE
jgi:Mg-chelatase subunit ChlD